MATDFPANFFLYKYGSLGTAVGSGTAQTSAGGNSTGFNGLGSTGGLGSGASQGSATGASDADFALGGASGTILLKIAEIAVRVLLKAFSTLVDRVPLVCLE